MSLQTPSVTLDDIQPPYGAVVSSPVPPPGAIAAERIWIAWNSVPQEGKLPRKVPVSIPGGSSTSVEKLTAATYAEAYEHLQAIGAAGLGLVLGTRMLDGLLAIGVDIDSCRDDATGIIAPWATEALAPLCGYAEVSPSQTGTKLFGLVTQAEAELIESAIALRKKAGGSRFAHKWSWATGEEHPPAIELFTRARWFAYTGQRLLQSPDLGRVDPAAFVDLVHRVGPAFKALDPGRAKPAIPAVPSTAHPASVNDNTARIDTSHPATDLWTRIRATNSFELRRLLNGDVDHLTDKSRSGVAMAIGGALKRDGYTQDEMKEALYDFAATSSWAAEQDDLDGRGFDRIWQNAGEAPPRPDPHIINYTSPPPGPPADHKRRGTVFTPRTAALNAPPVEWLYPGFVPKEGLLFDVGAPKTIKTFTKLLLAQCAVNVAPWAGVEPSFSEPLHVAYWAGEGRAGLNARLCAIETEYGFEPSDNLTLLSGVLQIDDVIAHYVDKRLDILFVDTLARWVSAAGLDENSARDMGLAIAELDRLREALGCCVIAIHHTGLSSDKRMRGSSALFGAADGLFMSTKTLPGVAVLECLDLKEGEPGSPVVYRLKKVGDSAVAVLADDMSPLPSGMSSLPRGDIETLIVEIVQSLMPSGKPPVPPRGAAVPLPPDIMTAAIASNGVLIAAARDLFVMRRPGTRRDIKVQAFTRALRSLQRKRLILCVGDWCRMMPPPATEGAL